MLWLERFWSGFSTWNTNNKLEFYKIKEKTHWNNYENYIWIFVPSTEQSVAHVKQVNSSPPFWKQLIWVIRVLRTVCLKLNNKAEILIRHTSKDTVTQVLVKQQAKFWSCAPSDKIHRRSYLGNGCFTPITPAPPGGIVGWLCRVMTVVLTIGSSLTSVDISAPWYTPAASLHLGKDVLRPRTKSQNTANPAL